ncbi:POT family MFS transporter [Anaeromyxobacter oryzae]|uniref:MFS transporter n=1 Tax=Anaeromyxobacter oryzae TaxID=2918170 RepID=A0ABM7WWY0_9BACT|nr:POT family MFS transporter [Anaeromyxobacter oryzae]BDG03990.1 MFS transporter [Anaeromyxobacter oryzae]
MTGRVRYPPQIKYIVGNEACERFSFYGMRSILTIYMLQFLVFAERDAKAYFHWFVMATYLTPLVGGWIADRWWGRYRTILWISLGYVAGHAVLAIWETPAGLLAGLALIAAGAGGIKPCVSAFVGDQFRPDQRTLFDRVYGWFYWSVNLGSASANALVPWLLSRHGPAVAFAVPGVLMALSLAVFWAGSRHYVRAPPSGPDPHGFLRVVGRAVRRLGTGRPGAHWLDGAADRHPPEAIAGARAVVRIIGVFAAVTLFWALFDQKASSWVIQARQMDLLVGGVELSPAQLQALNPFLIMALIPLFTWGVFPLLARRGIVLSPLRKMTAGMFIAVLSFAAAALVQTLVDRAAATPAALVAARPSVLWQIPQYVLLTVAEVLVSVTGLEFSYTQAPRAMRSTIMSIWFLTVALGNLLTALVTKLVRLEGAAYFWFFAALMLAAALAFRGVARRYDRDDDRRGALAA